MEIFKDIDGYDGVYAVSNLGNVISRKLNRIKILKPRLNGINGYLGVDLCYNGIHCERVHRLVAKAFIPNPENKSCVDHINNIKTDNRIENLRWASHSDNSANSTWRNITGFKGVTVNGDKYQAKIYHNGVRECLGTYITPEEAHTAYIIRARELFGEFAKA